MVRKYGFAICTSTESTASRSAPTNVSAVRTSSVPVTSITRSDVAKARYVSITRFAQSRSISAAARWSPLLCCSACAATSAPCEPLLMFSFAAPRAMSLIALSFCMSPWSMSARRMSSGERRGIAIGPGFSTPGIGSYFTAWSPPPMSSTSSPWSFANSMLPRPKASLLLRRFESTASYACCGPRRSMVRLEPVASSMVRSGACRPTGRRLY
jgi:hypothetical protein